MIPILDLTNESNKPLALKNFILEARKTLGGFILSLIIPNEFKVLMSDVALEPTGNTFYLYGWYEKFKSTIYVDETLTDSFYLICNDKNMKIKVIGA